VAVDRLAARRMANELAELRSPRARDRVRLLAIAAACAPRIAPGVKHWWVVLHEDAVRAHT
jgi:hypothetical protein